MLFCNREVLSLFVAYVFLDDDNRNHCEVSFFSNNVYHRQRLTINVSQRYRGEKQWHTHICRTSCLVSGSFVTYAVSPTADEPLPDVYWLRGTRLYTYDSNCDLLVPGSPHRRMLISALCAHQNIFCKDPNTSGDPSNGIKLMLAVT